MALLKSSAARQAGGARMRAGWLTLVLGAALFALPVAAELQSVQVGGELRIRGNYWRHSFERPTGNALVGNFVRWNSNSVRWRPIGDAIGGQTIVSFFDWDDTGNDYELVEQRTRLNVRADFTDAVAVFIELESYDVWGEDFRSDYLTGLDRRGAGSVETYQAYIEVNALFGAPVRARIGRQELVLGAGWLLGANNAIPEFPGLSFDAVRLTYARDCFTLDAFFAKLAERTGIEKDGDVDLYGLYAACAPKDAIHAGLYWLLVRDAISRSDTDAGPLVEALEDWLGLDDYDPTCLHTIGGRLSGVAAGFDYSLEAAYQFGNASAPGALFRPITYGDDDADFDAWAGDLEVGYTFDAAWSPRVWLGAAYFEGEDQRDISFREWLNPFTALAPAEASISFNRLFSDKVYSYFLDDQAALSNFWTVRGGLSVSPTECLRLGAYAAWFEALETFGQPLHLRVNGVRVPLALPFTFWTQPSDDSLGWEAGLWAEYAYSQDLRFRAGWSHFFTGDGLYDGNYIDLNGLAFNGGTDDNDADYFFLEAVIRF